MEIAAEGRGFSPADTAIPFAPQPLSRSRERGATKWGVRAFAAGLKPRPGVSTFRSVSIYLS